MIPAGLYSVDALISVIHIIGLETFILVLAKYTISVPPIITPINVLVLY
jgi:hypothetical protein